MATGRSTCAECQELKLQDCDSCKKPGGRSDGPPLDSLNAGNRFAYQVWSIFVKDNELKLSDVIALVEAKGGTEDDFDKVIQFDFVHKRLNGKRKQV